MPQTVAEEPALPSDIVFAIPEHEYAERVGPPEPERPLPAGRRAIFFDVENTSHAPHVERMLHHLAIDRLRSRTEFVAVGNWRVIGHDIARFLARHGAQLVHSAPAAGVRDWSDLRIAVSAGAWLAAARPGDRIEIVSDDRAFDAVGDVATALGIEFHRLSYRALTGAPAAEPSETAPTERERRHGRPRRRRGRAEPGPTRVGAGEREPAPRRHPAEEPPPAHGPGGLEPHTAPHDEIIHVVRELIHRAHGRPVLIDTLARELKSRGFGRTPGSPRLITRLRRIKELSVSVTGMIMLAEGGRPAEHHAPAAPPAPETEPAGAAPGEGARQTGAEAPPPEPAGQPQAPRRSRRRRRGRRRSTV